MLTPSTLARATPREWTHANALLTDSKVFLSNTASNTFPHLSLPDIGVVERIQALRRLLGIQIVGAFEITVPTLMRARPLRATCSVSTGAPPLGFFTHLFSIAP